MTLVSSLILKMRPGVLSWIMVARVRNRAEGVVLVRWVAVWLGDGGPTVRSDRPKPVNQQHRGVCSDTTGEEIYAYPAKFDLYHITDTLNRPCHRTQRYVLQERRKRGRFHAFIGLASGPGTGSLHKLFVVNKSILDGRRGVTVQFVCVTMSNIEPYFDSTELNSWPQTCATSPIIDHDAT